jgi:BASS family bile acid:Na+ symporter
MNVIDLLLPAALAFIMFALGLALELSDFKRVFARPRAMAVGLLAQMLVVPALAWGIAVALKLPATMAVGLMILAACPGGVSAGLITHLARGETALSISLTGVTSVAAIASVPVVIDASLHHCTGAGSTVDLPVARLVRGVFVLTTLPVALGMSLRHWQRRLAQRMERGAGRMATLFFVAIVVATFVSQQQALRDHLMQVGPAAALLNLAAMTLGASLAAIAGLRWRDRIAIASESGLQNAALGIYIATQVLALPEMAIPSVVYALLMNVSAIGLIAWVRVRGEA